MAAEGGSPKARGPPPVLDRQSSTELIQDSVLALRRWYIIVMDKVKEQMLRLFDRWKTIWKDDQRKLKHLRIIAQRNRARDVLKMDPDKRTRDQLQAVVDWAVTTSCFMGIHPRSLMELFHEVGIVDIREGEPIFFQGDLGDAYWIVVTGEISVCIFFLPQTQNRS